MADFSHEKQLWKKGFRVVAGADEVGRGAWAGPVVAGAVVWPATQTQKSKLKIQKDIIIDDSKKLTAIQREKAERWIKENCIAWGIGEVGATIINRRGLAKAIRMAFRRAIAECNRKLAFQSGIVNFVNSKVDYLLIDAFYLPYTKGLRRMNQKAIIRGDSKSFSIAAASIVAKVYRDRLMSELAKKHKMYGWDRNKGYGTREHQVAILKYGLTRLHRKSFVKRLLFS